MDQQFLQVLTCPICIEMLKKPVITLSCQHNFCKSCVIEIFESPLLQNRCPVCRENLIFNENGVDDLPRNRLVEQMIDEMGKTKAPPSNTSSATPPSLEQLKLHEIIVNLMNGKRFNKAKEALRQLEQISSGAELVFVKINLSKCMLELQDDRAAALAAKEILELDIQEEEKLKVSHDLRDLVKLLSGRYENEVAIALLRFSANLCDVIDDPTRKIDELMTCLDLMQGVTKSMSRRDMKRQFKDLGLPALTYIYAKITRVDNLKADNKCLKMAWSLKYIGFCCNEIGIYDSAVEYNNRAITLLREQFRHNVGKHRVLGVCYHNLAAAYKNLCQYQKAEDTYLKAIEAYHSATDWPDQRRQNSNVILSAIGLSETHNFVAKK